MFTLRSRLASIAAVTALAFALAPASASAATAGSSDFNNPTPLPIADFDSGFAGSNEGILTAATGGSGIPYWNNVAWYSVTPSETKTVYIRATSTSPAGWDNALEVWTAAGVMVAQNDDSYGLDAALTVTLDAGVEYRIGLGAYRSTGNGSVAMTFASRPPGAPDAPAAVAGDGSADVSWSAPSDIGGGVTQYQVLCTPEGGSESVCATLDGTPPDTSTTITGLTNGTAYTFRVKASNVIGYGDPSEPSAAVTPAVPSSLSIDIDPAAPVSGQPFSVSATVSSGGSPASGTVDITVGGVTTANVALVGGVATVTGLTQPAGDVAVSAAYAGLGAVAPSSASTTLTVARRSQTVTIQPLPGGLVYAGSPVTVTASSNEGLPVTLAASGACEIAGTELSLTGVGTCTVTATQAGTSEVLSAEASVQVSVTERSQVIVMEPLPALVFGMAPITLDAASEFDLPVSIAASGACVVDGVELSVVDEGECVVVVTAEADAVTLGATLTVRADVTVPPPDVDVLLSGTLGDQATGTGVTVMGAALQPGSTLFLDVHSTPQRIGSVIVAADGTATVVGSLPALEPGAHRLIASGVAFDGSPVEMVTTFTVSSTGVFIEIQGVTALADTGANPTGTLAWSAACLVLGVALLVSRRFTRPRVA